MKTGVQLIYEERQRQIVEEGWSEKHDDSHIESEMAMAAATYAIPSKLRPRNIFDLWPWAARWWKPTPEDRVRELSKAGALIAAEIDRIQRLQQ